MQSVAHQQDASNSKIETDAVFHPRLTDENLCIA